VYIGALRAGQRGGAHRLFSKGDVLRSVGMANLARRVLTACIPLAAAASLAGCGTARPAAPGAAAAAPRTVPCPQIARYSPELRNKAAKELDLLPVGSALEVFLGDYETLRDDLRACQDDGGSAGGPPQRDGRQG